MRLLTEYKTAPEKKTKPLSHAYVISFVKDAACLYRKYCVDHMDIANTLKKLLTSPKERRRRGHFSENQGYFDAKLRDLSVLSLN